MYLFKEKPEALRGQEAGYMDECSTACRVGTLAERSKIQSGSSMSGPMKCTTEVIVDERSEFTLISVPGPIDLGPLTW